MHNLGVTRKRNLISGIILGLFLTSFVSAFNGYGDLSLGGLLEGIDASTMILGTIWIILFTFTNFALSKFFKHKDGTVMKGPAGVVAFAFSLLVVWGINKMGWDYENFFYDIGLSGDLLEMILPFILIIGIIILFWKVGSATLLVIGALFIALGFSEILYESGVAYLLGAVCIILWLLWRFVFKKKDSFRPLGYRDNSSPGLLRHGVGTANEWAKQKAKQKWQQRKDAQTRKTVQNKAYEEAHQIEAKNREEARRMKIQEQKGDEAKAYEEKARRDGEAKRKQEEMLRKQEEVLGKQKAAEAKQLERQEKARGEMEREQAERIEKEKMEESQRTEWAEKKKQLAEEKKIKTT